MRGRLDRVGDITVVGEAASGDEAVELARELEPHVILMDIKMPGLNGIEATREIRQASPEVGVLVLTMFEDDDSVFAAMRAGALGYLLKDSERDDIVRAIRAVAAGEAIFGPEVARRVIAHFTSGAGSATAAFPTLTDREREILELIATGRGNATIAHDLVLSLKTVRNHVSNIFGKLAVSDRSAAIVKARDAGFGTDARSARPRR
jgi:DNA-binding NarL/FixJ family response regulator